MQIFVRLLRKLPDQAFADHETPYRLFLNWINYHGFFEGRRIYVRDMVQQIIESSIFDFRDTDLDKRMQIAIQVDRTENTRFFWQVLRRTDISHACVEASTLRDRGTTILCHCANMVANHIYYNHDAYACLCPLENDFVKLVAQAFELRDLSRSLNRGKSPLLSMMVKVSELFLRHTRNADLKTCLGTMKVAVHLWLGYLSEAGIDLGGYGREEFEFLSKQTSKQFPDLDTKVYGHFHTLRLVSFSWGQSTEEWKFWWSTSLDEIGDTFLLNYIPRASSASNTLELSPKIPGAWIDDEDSVDMEVRVYLGRLATSRRRRQRYLAGAGFDSHDARDVFKGFPFHGSLYAPRVPRSECLAYCPRYSECRAWEAK